MSVLRKLNVLPQLRVDAPHLRMIESAVAGDFDTVVGKMMAGGKPFVIRGFTLIGTSVGSAANQMTLVTADSIAVNLNASESGSFLWIPANRPNETLDSATNGKVTGSFASGVTNYVGIDFKRSPDASTTDLAKFLDADSLSSVKTESTRSIPLGLTLDYRIVISTVPFSSTPNIIPIAKVVTNVNNAISTIIDARPMMYRLATGGDFPNSENVYSWPFNRAENSSSNLFSGGDKNIASEKDWRDAIMSRIWELGGGENWYSPTADRNVRMVYEPGVVFSNGQNFEGVANNLHWRGLSILFDNANSPGVYYNEIADQLVDSAGLTDLAPGECIYADIDRTQNLIGVAAIVAQKAVMQTLGSPVVPGSRYIIAWRTSDAGNFTIWTRDGSYPVDFTFQPATPTSLGAVRLNVPSGTPGTPTVVTLNSTNSIAIGTVGYPVTGNNTAIIATGSGSGSGITSTGGATGNGIVATGGSTSGAGGVFTGTGTGNGVTAVSSSSISFAVSAQGFSPVSSAAGGKAGQFVGGDGSAATIGTARAGGAGSRFFGGNGSATNPGGAGGEGIVSDGGSGGNSPAGTGGAGAVGGQFVGGVGGDSFAPSFPGDGGAGVSAFGADSGIRNDGVRTNGGAGVRASGGAGFAGGAGVIGTGGDATLGGLGGAGGVFSGAVQGIGTAASDGVVAIGGDGGSVTGHGITAISGDGGFGGYFSGALGGARFFGTNANAPGIEASSNGTSTAVIASPLGSGKAFYAVAGDVVIQAANSFRYDTNVTKTMHVPMSDFQSTTEAGSFSPIVTISTANALAKLTSQTSGPATAAAKIRLPHGAYITSIEFAVLNIDGVARDTRWAIVHNTYNVAGYFPTVVHLSGGPTQTVTVPNSSLHWVPIPITAGLQAPDDGFTGIYLSLDATTSVQQLQIHGVKVTYTYTLESPMR